MGEIPFSQNQGFLFSSWSPSEMARNQASDLKLILKCYYKSVLKTHFQKSDLIRGLQISSHILSFNIL